MPGIFLIIVMVFLIALWIMGAYVDVKTIQKHNRDNSGLSGTRTEIVQEDSPKQKHGLQGENNGKESYIESGIPLQMKAIVPFAHPRMPLPVPTQPDPDPVDVPRERMRFLRLHREEEPAPDSEDSRDTPIPDSSPENTENSPKVLDTQPEEYCELSTVTHKDEMIQTESSVAHHSTQTVSHQQDIGVGEPSLTDDAAIQAIPERQDAQTGEHLLVRDVPIQNVPERQDASMEALPSHHDVSLGTHLSQHEQGVQYDLSTRSIGINTSSLPVEEKSIQALQSLRDASLQNSLLQESIGVGSHISYRSKEIQASPERNDASAQHSLNFKSIGLDPRSFHASDFSSLVISEEDHDSSSIKSSLKSENILDKIPLSESVWIEEEEDSSPKESTLKKVPLNLDEIPLAQSIWLDQEQSLVESVVISEYDIENYDENPPVKTLKSLKSKKNPKKDSDSFEIISPHKTLHSHSSSWELLEDEEK
mgnify:CR=1 FL=1